MSVFCPASSSLSPLLSFPVLFLPFPSSFLSALLPTEEDAVLTSSLDLRSGYAITKIQENNTAEIMDVVENDARESYAEEIVVVLNSETPEQMEENIGRIVSWVEAWVRLLSFSPSLPIPSSPSFSFRPYCSARTTRMKTRSRSC